MDVARFVLLPQDQQRTLVMNLLAVLQRSNERVTEQIQQIESMSQVARDQIYAKLWTIYHDQKSQDTRMYAQQRTQQLARMKQLQAQQENNNADSLLASL